MIPARDGGNGSRPGWMTRFRWNGMTVDGKALLASLSKASFFRSLFEAHPGKAGRPVSARSQELARGGDFCSPGGFTVYCDTETFGHPVDYIRFWG